MPDPTEIAALKASFRGAVSTADALAALREQVDRLDPSVEIDASVLDDLQRVTTAHAIASAALRGLVETMIARRRP